MNKTVFKSCKICGSEIEKVNDKFNLVRCYSCKLIFCKNIYLQEDFEKTYRSLYSQSQGYNHYQEKFKKLKTGKKVSIGRTKLQVLKMLSPKKHMDVMELGAGIGLVADYLKRKNHNYYGLELDRKTVKQAQEIGLNIHQGDFTTMESFNKTFDAILAFEVIEHLQDLEKMFSLVYEKLKPGGCFGFTVPNYQKRENYENPKDKIYQSGPPIHLNFFTLESLKNIAKYFDFEIIELRHKKYPYFNWQKRDTYKFLFRSFFNRYYGPTLLVVFKKR